MKLQGKIIAVSLPLAAASALVVSLVGLRTTESVMVAELGRRLRPQVEDFAVGMAKDLEAQRETALLSRLQSAQAFSAAAYAEALLPDGTVAAHTNVLETGKRREDAQTKLGLASEETTFFQSQDARGPLLVLSAPVWRPDEEFLLSGGPRQRVGTLRLGIPLRPTLESARRVGVIVAGMAVTICLLALGLSLALLRIVLGPVREIAEATARVAAGDYGVAVPVNSHDELGELAEAFNRMGEKLSRTVVSRDRLEEALAIARATLDASADGILVVDRELHAVTYNRRFVEMWGLTEEIMRAGDVRRMAEFVSPQLEDAGSFVQLATMNVVSELDQERRDMIRLKDGRVFDRISRPYRIAGALVGRTITTRDLTLHLEGVRALAQARDEALETARVKSQFLANVSHELRTPLNAVIGSAELLTSGRIDPEQAEFAATLTSAARTLLDLVDGVLDFSKIEAGRMTVELTALKPGPLLQDAAALVAPRAAEKGLRLRVDSGDCGSWDLLGDPVRLRQVLLNLLSNAVKFTDRGEVVAEVRGVARGESGVELEFSVRDTGIGVPADQVGRLFSPFTQGDGSTTRRFGGTGLGLAISKSLVELMGGEIGFESEEGRGTRFWFRIRLDRSGAASAAVAVAPLKTAGRRDRLRILAVEDNATNRRLLAKQLERLGCPCETAEDGRVALDALASQEFGLVLLDCQMPGRDGYATAAEIRRRENGRRRVPIVAFTANATEEDRRRCLDAGMDDFIAKPVTLDALAVALDRWDRPFDEAALASFAAVAADAPQALARLLDEFLSDARERLASARSAAGREDFAVLARDAHTVKGAAAAVGAAGLRELCRRLESAAAESTDRALFDSLLAQADAELARLRDDAARRAAA
jgi:signal transduction histidine kinase/DNA-binding response OmpR family regulator